MKLLVSRTLNQNIFLFVPPNKLFIEFNTYPAIMFLRKKMPLKSTLDLVNQSLSVGGMIYSPSRWEK